MNNITGLVIATKIEAEPFINGLKLSLFESKPIRFYSNNTIILSISDIGKSNAAIASSLLIEKYHVSMVINLGAAGAAVPGFNIGAILHINKIYELDRPRLLSGDPVIHNPDTLNDFTMASLATQDRPILNESERLAAGVFADLVDMEGAAVVQACRMFGARAYLYKIVTDTAGCSTIDIIKNMLATRNSLFRFFSDRVMPHI